MNKTETTLVGFMSDWLENAIKPSTQYSTYNAYEGYIRNHIAPQIGEVKLAALTPFHIQKLASDLHKDKGLSARTIKIVLGVLSAALKFAEDCDYILRSPYRRIRLPKIEEEEVDAFTTSEQTKIEQAITGSADSRESGFLIMLYTGIRLNEMTALKWSCVDFAARTIHIKASMSRAENTNGGTKTILTAAEPKTKKSKRVIDLPDFLIDILLKAKAERSSDYVISESHGGFVNPRTLQKLFKKLLAECGIPPRKLHALRHTFCVRALETGMNVKVIADVMGHADGGVLVLCRYGHAQNEQKVRLMADLNLYFLNKARTATFQT
jgi:integrase